MEDIKGVIRAVSRRTNDRMSKDKRYNAEGQTIECRRTNDRMSNKRKETNNDQ